MFTELKYRTITNFLLILFPICFATNVCLSLMKENALVNGESIQVNENVCLDSICLNVGFAVILAAIWNGQKVIKTGAL